MDLQALLRDWAREWLQSRDVVSHVIISIEETSSGGLTIHRSDGDQVVWVQPLLEDKWIVGIEAAHLIITLNIRENVQEVVSKWAVLVKNEKLLIVFVNTHTKGDQKWVLRPSTHNRIAEVSYLHQGLCTMAEQVEEWRG